MKNENEPKTAKTFFSGITSFIKEKTEMVKDKVFQQS